MKFRMERVDLEIKNSVSRIIANMDDSRLSGHFITICDVKTSPDLYSSRISVCFLDNNEKEHAEILKVLNASKGYIRKGLAQSIDIKRVPDIFFVEDRTEQKASRIDDILRQISKGNRADDEQ